MSIGFGIFLTVVGAILAFALRVSVDWIDLRFVGYLCMGAGVVVVLLGIVMLARRRQSIATEHAMVDAATGDRVAPRTTRSDPTL